jgi:hypothetical protein
VTGGGQLPRWPLFLIAAPAAVAIWSGWVGLGQMCGFGPVNLLPGIGSGFHVNTAITLPVGVEAYGAYALGAWLTPGTPERARAFARRSAIGALALGMLGQVVYHLLAAAGADRAPWPVVVLVSCIPVITLGFGAALTHLLRAEPLSHLPVKSLPHGGEFVTPECDAPTAVPAVSGVHLNGSGVHPAEAEPFAAELARGEVPSIRRIRSELHVGQPKAQEVQGRLAALVSTRPGCCCVEESHPGQAISRRSEGHHVICTYRTARQRRKRRIPARR